MTHTRNPMPRPARAASSLAVSFAFFFLAFSSFFASTLAAPPPPPPPAPASAPPPSASDLAFSAASFARRSCFFASSAAFFSASSCAARFASTLEANLLASLQQARGRVTVVTHVMNGVLSSALLMNCEPQAKCRGVTTGPAEIHLAPAQQLTALQGTDAHHRTYFRLRAMTLPVLPTLFAAAACFFAFLARASSRWLPRVILAEAVALGCGAVESVLQGSAATQRANGHIFPARARLSAKSDAAAGQPNSGSEPAISRYCGLSNKPHRRTHAALATAVPVHGQAIGYYSL